MSRGFPFGLVLLIALGFCPATMASEAHTLYEDLYTPGNGSVSLSYQYIKADKFQNGADLVDMATVTTQSLYLEFEYAFAERWRMQLGVPYVWKKNLSTVHNPLALVPPRPEVPFLDDGTWNNDFQDFYGSLHYLWIDQPVRLEPFVRVFIPSHDYPHFGNAAIGQNLWKVEVGMELTHYPLFSDWYYRLEAAYGFVEQTLDVNVNFIRGGGEVGYFLTPTFAVNAFFLGKKGRGNNAQMFPPPTRTTEAWYQHDRTLQHSSLNLGVGTDWFVGENYQVFASVFGTVWGESVHWVDFAVTTGLSRYF